MSSLTDFFLNLNLFESADDNETRDDEQRRRSNIIATRVYVAILTSVLVLVGLVSWLSHQTTIITLEHPSKDQFSGLPLDAQCPCSRISLSYGELTSIEASFHQVCSSDFVSDRWIKVINSDSNSTYFYLQDFRTFGSAQFEALAGFCRLSEANILQNIASYQMNTLISPQVLSESVFQSQIQASIKQFQLTAPNVFTAQSQLVRGMTKGNRLVSGLQTNNIQIYESVNDHPVEISLHSLHYERNDGSICDCSVGIDCESPAGIYEIFGAPTQLNSSNNLIRMRISGISAGCLPVDSILSSTLECFYDQICIDELIAYFPTTEKFTAMNVTEPSRFNPNSTVESIVDRLMVEQWITTISYDQYYSQCAPIQCIYSNVERHSLVFVLTSLISLLGGSTIVLGFIVPIPIRAIQRPQTFEQTPQYPLHVQLRQHMSVVKKVVVEMNMFKRDPSNDRQIRYQRYATRVYILVVIISLSILAFYTLLGTTIQRQTVLNPTESEYNELEEMYSSTLSCPCSSISMSYSTFLGIQPHYHQVCSSDLVSSQWIQYISVSNSSLSDPTFDLDFRVNAASQFQSLAMFCQEAQQTIDDALDIFLQTQFVGSQVIPIQLLDAQVIALFQGWQSTTIDQYVRTIQLVRATTQGNQLMSTLNFDYSTNLTTQKTTLTPKNYSNCSCALSQSCLIDMFFYTYDSDSKMFIALDHIPNFFLGCYPIDALLASTLECFYNRSCLIDIDQYMPTPLGEQFHFSTLDANLSWPSETIESLVNGLMVDVWWSNVSFGSYYNACAPQSCTYEYSSGTDFYSVVTTIIGVFGGLSLAFELLIVFLLRMTEKMFVLRLPGVNLMHSIRSSCLCSEEQQMINRLYSVLVVTTLATLYAFSAFTPQLITVQMEKPSLSTYQDLSTRFPTSLQCPCSQISINYGSFFNVVPYFHQVCSSMFVSDGYIAYLYDDGDLTSRFAPGDFRSSATGQFQLLASLCELSQETVTDSLEQLATSKLINSQLLSPSLLDNRIQATFGAFQTTMPNFFFTSLNSIRETTAANMIMTTLSTSWVVATPAAIQNGWTAHTEPLVYGGCSCGLSSKCVQPSEDMHVGCYPLEALFQSTFECLYDQQCIDSSGTFSAMNFSSNPTRFGINTTIESIVNQLMIEEYSSEMSYERYFAQCAPSSCTYSYIDHSNPIKAITYLIGLYGGLVIICRTVAVSIVKLIQSRTRRINPTSN